MHLFSWSIPFAIIKIVFMIYLSVKSIGFEKADRTLARINNNIFKDDW